VCINAKTISCSKCSSISARQQQQQLQQRWRRLRLDEISVVICPAALPHGSSVDTSDPASISTDHHARRTKLIGNWQPAAGDLVFQPMPSAPVGYRHSIQGNPPGLVLSSTARLCGWWASADRRRRTRSDHTWRRVAADAVKRSDLQQQQQQQLHWPAQCTVHLPLDFYGVDIRVSNTHTRNDNNRLARLKTRCLATD